MADDDSTVIGNEGDPEGLKRTVFAMEERVRFALGILDQLVEWADSEALDDNDLSLPDSIPRVLIGACTDALAEAAEFRDRAGEALGPYGRVDAYERPRGSRFRVPLPERRPRPDAPTADDRIIANAVRALAAAQEREGA